MPEITEYQKEQLEIKRKKDDLTEFATEYTKVMDEFSREIKNMTTA
jgi:hypothetical protein